MANKREVKTKKQPKKKVKVLLLDTKRVSEREFEYTGDDSINKILGCKAYAKQLRTFRDTKLTVYYDPEQQGIDQAPISIIGCKAMPTDTTIYGKAIVASTTEAGYIGSLEKNHVELLKELARYVHWRWHEDTVYYGVMTTD